MLCCAYLYKIIKSKNVNVIHASGATAVEAAGSLQPCLDGFVNWCESNKLIQCQ